MSNMEPVSNQSAVPTPPPISDPSPLSDASFAAQEIPTARPSVASSQPIDTSVTIDKTTSAGKASTPGFKEGFVKGFLDGVFGPRDSQHEQKIGYMSIAAGISTAVVLPTVSPLLGGITTAAGAIYGFIKTVTSLFEDTAPPEKLGKFLSCACLTSIGLGQTLIFRDIMQKNWKE